MNDTGPHLFCVLNKRGSNSYSNLAVAPFSCKKNGIGWMGGWMDVRAGLRIAYSNKKRQRKIRKKEE